MKIKCEVCKTEYSLPAKPSGDVKCAICGNVWRVAQSSRRGVLMVFFASLCALLAAAIFAVVVIVTSRRDDPDKRPLVATISDITMDTRDGLGQITVHGTVTNRSDDIYGFPDVIIVLHDSNGAPIARQRFMPSATLLDAGQSVNFSHTLTGDTTNIKRVSVELLDVPRGKTK